MLRSSVPEKPFCSFRICRATNVTSRGATRQEIGATSSHRDLQQVAAPIGPVFQIMTKLGGLSTAEQGRDGCIDGWADAIIGEGFPNVPTLALK